MFSSFQFKTDIMEQVQRAKGFGQVFDKKDVVSADIFWFQGNMHVGAGFGRFFQAFYFIQHLFPAFRPFDGFFPVERF